MTKPRKKKNARGRHKHNSNDSSNHMLSQSSVVDVIEADTTSGKTESSAPGFSPIKADSKVQDCLPMNLPTANLDNTSSRDEESSLLERKDEDEDEIALPCHENSKQNSSLDLQPSILVEHSVEKDFESKVSPTNDIPIRTMAPPEEVPLAKSQLPVVTTENDKPLKCICILQ